ncbi:hypothetical protein BH11PSE10_BH11PSE10_07320 [soil metagenome]
MNTNTANRLALALIAAITASVALTAALAVIPQDGAPPEIVKLERVVIVGQRADADVRLTKASCTAPSVC